MAVEHEIERMVVRLMGDGSSYEKMLQSAIQSNARFESEMKSNARIQTEMARNSQALNDRMIRKEFERQSAITTANNEAARSSRAFLSELGGNLQSAGMQLTIFGGIFTGVMGSVVTNALMAAGQYQQTNVAFGVMMQSQSQATALLQELTRFAAETPFEMPEVESAARGLVTFGERGEVLMRTMKDIGNAASATNTQFGMVALIYNQIRGAGKLLTQDFRQLSQRGILSLQDLADHFGVTLTAAQEMLSGGEITFNDVKAIFRDLSAEGGRFANMMEKQSTTLLGKWSTFKDQFNITMRQIGSTMVGGMTDILAIGVKFMDWAGNLSPEMRGIIASSALMALAFGTIVTVMGSTVLIGGTLVTTYNTLSLAMVQLGIASSQSAVGVGMLKVALVGLGAAAIIAGIVAIRTELKGIESDAQDAMDRVNEIAGNRRGQIQNQKDPMRQKEQMDREIRSAQTALRLAQDRLAVEKSRQNNLSVPMALYEWSANKVFGADPATTMEADVKAAEERMKAALTLQDKLGNPTANKLTVDDIISKDTLGALERFYGRAAHAGKEFWKQTVDQIEEQKKFHDGVRESTESLKMQVMTFGMSSEAAKLYEMTLNGATKEERAEFSAWAKKMDARRAAAKAEKEHKKLLEESEQLTKKHMSPSQKLAEARKELQAMLDLGENNGGINLKTFNAEMKDLENQFNKDYVAKLKVEGQDAVAADSAEAMGRLMEFARTTEMKTGGGRDLSSLTNKDRSDILGGWKTAADLGISQSEFDRIKSSLAKDDERQKDASAFDRLRRERAKEDEAKYGGGKNEDLTSIAIGIGQLVALAQQHWTGEAIEIETANLA